MSGGGPGAMLNLSLVGAPKKRVVVEVYLAPGVSITHPDGPYQIDPHHTLETLGHKFLKDVKEPNAESSAVESLTAAWAVLRQETQIRTFGRSQVQIKDTGLYDALDSGDQLVLIPAGNDTATIGFEEVAAPADVDTAGCCVIA